MSHVVFAVTRECIFICVTALQTLGKGGSLSQGFLSFRGSGVDCSHGNRLEKYECEVVELAARGEANGQSFRSGIPRVRKPVVRSVQADASDWFSKRSEPNGAC